MSEHHGWDVQETPVGLRLERECVVLYWGDAREVIPTLPKSDLVLTDPPYGIGVDGQAFSTSKHGGRKPYEFQGWDKCRPDGEFIRRVLNAGENAILWGGNYFAEHLPPSMGWLVWDKGQDICSSDCELAFTTFDKALRRTVINRVELQKDGAVHPTQKPVKLMLWCLQYAGEKCETVIDPFMGSGSTGVACVKAQKRFIGIEKSPAHFDTATRRITQALLTEKSSLFPVKQPHKQSELFATESP